MKVTRGNLRDIIREMLLREQEEDLTSNQSSVELTERPDESAVSDAWPAAVFHNGKKVFDTFYGDNAASAHDYLRQEGYDGQEVYLGYDPQSDNFVMGFDAFLEEGDQWDDWEDESLHGGSSSEMDGVLILLDPRGRALETIDAVAGGMYPAGIREVEIAMPEIIHVRLD